jgi:hypothetical protein
MLGLSFDIVTILFVAGQDLFICPDLPIKKWQNAILCVL